MPSPILNLVTVSCVGVSLRRRLAKSRKCVGLLHLCSLAAFHSAVGRCTLRASDEGLPRLSKAGFTPLIFSALPIDVISLSAKWRSPQGVVERFNFPQKIVPSPACPAGTGVFKLALASFSSPPPCRLVRQARRVLFPHGIHVVFTE